jgi:Lrp/AsnC family transcriptional regulator, regulator for asnA, asnC and gidA
VVAEAAQAYGVSSAHYASAGPGAAIQEVRVTSNGGRQVVLDDVSRAIIEQLQQDGRRSYARIASAVGLSEAAVRQRVQRLLDAGVMQIVAVTDPMQVGFPRQAMVGVRARGDVRSAADKLAAMPEVDYVVVTAGSFDVILEIVCEDDERLLDTVARIRAADGVESTETFVYLGLRKQTYAWGTRRTERGADEPELAAEA